MVVTVGLQECKNTAPLSVGPRTATINSTSDLCVLWAWSNSPALVAQPGSGLDHTLLWNRTLRTVLHPSERHLPFKQPDAQCCWPLQLSTETPTAFFQRLATHKLLAWPQKHVASLPSSQQIPLQAKPGLCRVISCLTRAPDLTAMADTVKETGLETGWKCGHNRQRSLAKSWKYGAVKILSGSTTTQS